MAKIEATHLLTLSEFVSEKGQESQFTARQAEEIIQYNNFLNQPLKMELFDSSDNASIFKNFQFLSSTNSWHCIGEGCHIPRIVFVKNKAVHGPRTLAELAEATKNQPLKFRKTVYFYNEEVH